MTGFLEHLGLIAWPFSIVPRQQYCNYLAGRPQLTNDISALVRGWSRRDTSSIHLLWSWLGAGKTHSLFFLMKQCAVIRQLRGCGSRSDELALRPCSSSHACGPADFARRANHF